MAALSVTAYVSRVDQSFNWFAVLIEDNEGRLADKYLLFSVENLSFVH